MLISDKVPEQLGVPDIAAGGKWRLTFRERAPAKNVGPREQS